MACSASTTSRWPPCSPAPPPPALAVDAVTPRPRSRPRSPPASNSLARVDPARYAGSPPPSTPCCRVADPPPPPGRPRRLGRCACLRDGVGARPQLDDVEPFAGVTPDWAWGGSTWAMVCVSPSSTAVSTRTTCCWDCVETAGRGGGGCSGVTTVVDDVAGDDFGHGTACAGIIHSIAPRRRIVSVKVLGEGLSGKAAAFHRGCRVWRPSRAVRC